MLPEPLSGVADARAKVSRLAAEKVESMPDLAAADLAPTLQQAFGDLLSSLGPEASAGIGAALQGFTSGVMTLMSELPPLPPPFTQPCATQSLRPRP